MKARLPAIILLLSVQAQPWGTLFFDAAAREKNAEPEVAPVLLNTLSAETHGNGQHRRWVNGSASAVAPRQVRVGESWGPGL